MGLFDQDDIRSAEARALWDLIDLLTACESVQELAEATGGNAGELQSSARTRFIIGPHSGPWDSDQFTIAELEARFVEFQLYVPMEGGRGVVKSDGSFDRADETGEIHLITRRLCREAELKAFNTDANITGRQDLYLGFTDCISAMEQEAMTLAESRNCPTLRSFVRVQGPSFGLKSYESTQGEYLFARHSITWGDSISD